jgi:hypothetical protein
MRLLVQIQSGEYREVAQLAACLIWDQEVKGSSPFFPIYKKAYSLIGGTFRS